MPALQLNKLLGALRFQSKGLEMPSDYVKVTPAERNAYLSSLSPEARVALPQLIPQWFKPALSCAPHQLMCDTVGQQIKEIHDTFLDAVGYAHNMWRLQAKFTPMPIAGPSVAGPPGCLTGPPLDALIGQYPGTAKLSSFPKVYCQAMAKGVAKAFSLWQASVTVPGLPLFPAYAMQPPGPAIPTPAVPQKLIACVSAGMTALVVPDTMKELMGLEFKKAGVAGDASTGALFDAIATVLSLAFVNWITNQMVLGLVGSGAVASVVGGPVAGVTLPTVGHLAT